MVLSTRLLNWNSSQTCIVSNSSKLSECVLGQFVLSNLEIRSSTNDCISKTNSVAAFFFLLYKYCGIISVCGGQISVAFVGNPCSRIYIPTNVYAIICFIIYCNNSDDTSNKITFKRTRKISMPTNIDPNE